MSVRITRSTDGERTVLKVAGRLRSADLAILHDEIHSVEGSLAVDLSELISVDEAGIQKLHELASNEAELRGVSQYVQMLLDDQES